MDFTYTNSSNNIETRNEYVPTDMISADLADMFTTWQTETKDSTSIEKKMDTNDTKDNTNISASEESKTVNNTSAPGAKENTTEATTLEAIPLEDLFMKLYEKSDESIMNEIYALIETNPLWKSIFDRMILQQTEDKNDDYMRAVLLTKMVPVMLPDSLVRILSCGDPTHCSVALVKADLKMANEPKLSFKEEDKIVDLAKKVRMTEILYDDDIQCGWRVQEIRKQCFDALPPSVRNVVLRGVKYGGITKDADTQTTAVMDTTNTILGEQIPIEHLAILIQKLVELDIVPKFQLNTIRRQMKVHISETIKKYTKKS